jgi:hypothetical protein
MKRRAALIVVLLAGGGALSHTQPTQSASNDPQKARPPTLLWKTFPLRQQTTPRGESQPRAGLRSGDDRSSNWLWVPIATMLVLSGTAVAIFLSHSRRRGGHMDWFRPTRTGGGKVNDESQQNLESLAEHEHLGGADRVIDYLSTAEAEPSDSESRSSVVTEDDSIFDRLGENVSSVLSAAKAAAVRIEEESRQEAERVRDLAQREATDHLEAAREDAYATRAEAERLRSETEEWTEQARTAAEKSAADRRAEADAEAREIVAAAERHAASLSEEADARQQALKRDSALVEERLRQLATALHDLAGRLDTLLSTQPQAQEGVIDDQSLIDALGPSRETEEARM